MVGKRTQPHFTALSAILALYLVSAVCWAEFENATIVFGGDAAYPPFEWVEDGRPRGFDVELEDAMAAIGGAKAEHRLGDWPDAVRALESGDVDVLAMFYSEQRAETFLFTPPFHFVHHGIYAREGVLSISSINELDGQRVAVEELSDAHQHIEAEELPVTLVLTRNTETALLAVVDGAADYAILAAPTANFLIREQALRLINVGPPIWPRGYAFAVRKDRPALAEWMTQQFHETLKNGTYQEIYANWDEYFGQSEEGALSRALKIAAIPLAAFALFGVAWVLRLRRTDAMRRLRLLEESTRRHAAELRARWMADHDHDTELPRLHHFSDQVTELLLKIQPGMAPKQIVALKLLDLDRTICTLGHEAGLNIVRDFANRLRTMEFQACGQTGRDMFLIFGDKDRIDDTLRSAVSPTETGIIDPGAIPRMCAGAATWPKHGRTLKELLRKAETALSVATERREAWIEYRKSMEPSERELQILRVFRESSGAGLYPVFQPQVDVLTGAVTGAEALARWDASGLGALQPAQFIPLLEDSGLIHHVTRRMIREAIRVGAELRRKGIICPISVNVAVSDLLSDQTRKNVFKALRLFDARPSDLKLELTETSVAERPEALQWIITRLRDSGIRTSIDDFGTGYSSLSYLSGFPIDEVKIDRSFVNGMSSRPRDRSIVRSTIAMAHELGLRVVAEGVETDADMSLLRADSCDCAQGFLISEPLVEAEFIEFVQSRITREPAAAHRKRGRGGATSADE